MSALLPKADIADAMWNVRFVPCVDGSELARDIFTFAELVGAAMCSACLRGSHDRWAIMPFADQVPVRSPHSRMQRHNWVVLIAKSTGSALRAVRPPNLHITSGD